MSTVSEDFDHRDSESSRPNSPPSEATTLISEHPSFPEELLAEIASDALALDLGERDSRAHVLALAAAGVAGLGAPRNCDDGLNLMAGVVSEVAGVCMSTAFSLWAHRMTTEFLTFANTAWSMERAAELLSGQRLGVTAMAGSFKEAAGCGSLDLEASVVSGGFRINGTLRWASNLFHDSVMVTGVRTDDGRRLIVGLPLDADGVGLGAPFELLAMGGTSSSFVKINDVFVPDTQVLSEDFLGFLAAVRPTFLTLQSAMCLGLAERCLGETEKQLVGVNEVMADEVAELRRKHAETEQLLGELAHATATDAEPTKLALLTLRLAAAELATAAAGLEVRTAGGKGYARRTDTSRRFREAAFIPVQSPSETQLRWELAQLS